MKTTISFKKYIASLLASLAITFLILIAFSLVLTFFNVSEAIIRPSPTILFFLSSFLSGFFSSRKTNRSGWLTGAIASFFYGIIILLLSIIFSFQSITLSGALKTIIYSLPFGIIGGILGINSK